MAERDILKKSHKDKLGNLWVHKFWKNLTRPNQEICGYTRKEICGF